MTVAKLVEHTDKLLASRDDDKLIAFLEEKSEITIARIINGLVRGKRKTFSRVHVSKQGKVALHLNRFSLKSVLPRLNDQTIAESLSYVTETEATRLLRYISSERVTKILDLLHSRKRAKLEVLLSFEPETAGGIMNLNFIKIPGDMIAKDILQEARKHAASHEKRIPLVIVEENGVVIGYIPVKQILLADPKDKALDLVHELPIIHNNIDQGSVLSHLEKLNGDAIGVCDEEEKLIGIIHIDDLLKVARYEATEDVYKFAGVDKEESIEDSIAVKIKRRSKWLIINLGTAFMAAWSVSLFEDTIARLAILAVFMPIVAGEGGNAATQALAVVVRGLAAGEVSAKQARLVIIRESIAGIGNGLIVGIITGFIALLFHANAMLGVVLGLAMVINMFIAGFFGSIVPFILKKFNIDPAIASSVFVTTATDIIGFIAFLGLGSLIL